MKETDDAMRVSLLEDQKINEFKLRRHKLLSDELVLLGRYNINVPSNGCCQFAALAMTLAPLVKHPRSNDKELREQIVNYLLANKESLEEEQQLVFRNGDAAFKKDLEAAYGDI